MQLVRRYASCSLKKDGAFEVDLIGTKTCTVQLADRRTESSGRVRGREMPGTAA